MTDAFDYDFTHVIVRYVGPPAHDVTAMKMLGAVTGLTRARTIPIVKRAIPIAIHRRFVEALTSTDDWIEH